MDQLIPKHRQITIEVADVLISMLTKLNDSPDFIEQKYYTPMIIVLFHINKKGGLRREQKDKYEIFQAKIVHSNKERKVKPSMQKYLNEHESQLALNRRFHDFVENLSLSYQNDAACPPYSPEHSLPLGEEFQRHVAAFTEKSK